MQNARKSFVIKVIHFMNLPTLKQNALIQTHFE